MWNKNCTWGWSSLGSRVASWRASVRELAHSESWILVTLAVSATDAEIKKKNVKKMVKKWSKKWSKNGPKMVKKWSKNGPKMVRKWSKMVKKWSKNVPKWLKVVWMAHKWPKNWFKSCLKLVGSPCIKSSQNRVPLSWNPWAKSFVA